MSPCCDESSEPHHFVGSAAGGDELGFGGALGQANARSEPPVEGLMVVSDALSGSGLPLLGAA